MGNRSGLQNLNKPHRFLAIKKGGLTTGSGGRNCVFRPNFHKNGTVTFMSVNFPGRHIGINDDQTARNPKTLEPVSMLGSTCYQLRNSMLFEYFRYDEF